MGRLTFMGRNFIYRFIVFSLTFSPVLSLAQDTLAPTSPVSVSKNIDPLARLPLVGQSAENKEFHITKDNVPSFQNYLLQPLVEWIEQNKAVFRAWRGWEVESGLSSSWQVGSATNEGVYRVEQQRNLGVNILTSRELSGFPFYPAETINQESDAKIRADKILWNMALGFFDNHDLQLDWELSWFSDKSLLRKARGFYYALQQGYPKVIEDAQDKVIDNEAVLLQTLFKVTSPAAIYGYASVVERYWGPRADQNWIYSPVIERSRKVSASNRGDVLLAAPLTLDDFFVWSGKLQSFQARVIEEKTILSFYAHSGQLKLQREVLTAESYQAPTNTEGNGHSAGQAGKVASVYTARGALKRYDGNNVFVLLNHDTQKYPTSLPWLPVSAYFVPRKVWIVELTPNDPFYPHSRQILFVDQESMLPLYRLSYDISGRLAKIVMGVWAQATSADQQVGIPIPALVVVSNADATQVCAINTLAARTFYPEHSAARDSFQRMLDISQHEKAMSAVAEKNAPSAVPKEVRPEEAAVQMEPSAGDDD